MEFIIRNLRISPLNLAREIGYTSNIYSQTTELNFVRIITKNNYPRFHIYIKKNEQDYLINLHIDQKKQSYKKNSIHTSEYNGKVIENEMQRIKSILSKDDISGAFFEHSDQTHEHTEW
jgi:hypothetical protein